MRHRMKANLWEPTSEQATSLRGFTYNGEHYIKNAKEIRKKYAGKFVAIYNQDVILSTMKANDLLTQVKGRFSQSDLSEVYIAYIPTEQEVRIASRRT